MYANELINELHADGWSDSEALDFLSTIEPVVIDAQPTDAGEQA
jgi:hypothetical protein